MGGELNVKTFNLPPKYFQITGYKNSDGIYSTPFGRNEDNGYQIFGIDLQYVSESYQPEIKSEYSDYYLQQGFGINSYSSTITQRCFSRIRKSKNSIYWYTHTIGSFNASYYQFNSADYTYFWLVFF